MSKRFAVPRGLPMQRLELMNNKAGLLRIPLQQIILGTHISVSNPEFSGLKRCLYLTQTNCVLVQGHLHREIDWWLSGDLDPELPEIYQATQQPLRCATPTYDGQWLLNNCLRVLAPASHTVVLVVNRPSDQFTELAKQ